MLLFLRDDGADFERLSTLWFVGADCAAFVLRGLIYWRRRKQARTFFRITGDEMELRLKLKTLRVLNSEEAEQVSGGTLVTSVPMSCMGCGGGGGTGGGTGTPTTTTNCDTRDYSKGGCTPPKSLDEWP